MRELWWGIWLDSPSGFGALIIDCFGVLFDVFATTGPGSYLLTSDEARILVVVF